ncbi:unnamed protein product [marine sediment metagenome]|uniref:Uncharacterized protein n=1 Tax=marine sediment metagenome TaxID=412755 RepID=X1HXU4_9ZZZZ
MNLRSNAGVQFHVLSEDQCEQIELAAFEVLERVGARFYDPEAVDILRKAGCTATDDLIGHPRGFRDPRAGSHRRGF